ncbi:MAG: hypothetical protein HC937_03635 [Aquincola sp.]|nr:hypothetical protein [Aquincola sp.]
MLAGVRDTLADLGWEATFQTFEGAAETREPVATTGTITVLGRLVALPDQVDTFQGLITATEAVFAADNESISPGFPFEPMNRAGGLPR